MQHSAAAAAAVPRTRESDAYNAYMHQIRGFAVLQPPRSAAFLTWWFQLYTNHHASDAARHDGSFELGTTNWGAFA